jgi:hypothetical protein
MNNTVCRQPVREEACYLSRVAGVRFAAAQAIAACGGDAHEAVKALLVANEFLEAELATQVSGGYLRGVKHGRFNTYSG